LFNKVCVRPDEIEDIKQFVEDMELVGSIELLLKLCDKYTVNSPLLFLIDKSVLKFVAIFDDKINNHHYLFNPVLSEIKKFNRSNDLYKININRVTGVNTYFTGSIVDNMGNDIVLFEMGSSSVFLYNLLYNNCLGSDVHYYL